MSALLVAQQSGADARQAIALATYQRWPSVSVSISTVGSGTTSCHWPQDETSFYLFEATSAEAVRLATERAGLSPLRIVEAVESTTGEGSWK